MSTCRKHNVMHGWMISLLNLVDILPTVALPDIHWPQGTGWYDIDPVGRITSDMCRPYHKIVLFTITNLYT